MGQTASLPHTSSAPCPCGARQRRPTHAFAGGRLLLPSPAAVCSRCRSNRNETQRPCPLLVGHGRVCTEPKALDAGTAGWAAGRASPPLAPAEQGIATPALKTLAYRLFFPLCAVLPIFSVQGHAIEPQLHLRSRFCAEGIVGQQGEMTLPCPAGKGALPVCGERRCLPCGQKRFRVARLILVCHGREQKVGALCPSGTAGRRAGRTEACPPALYEAAESPQHPAGRPAGSARTRSRDSSLENPFLENRTRSPPAPVPKRRRRQAPARGPAAVYFCHRPVRNETQHAHPCSWGGRASTPRQRLWPPALPA